MGRPAAKQVLAKSAPVPPPLQMATVLPPVEPLGVPSVPRWKRGHDSKMRKRVAKILVLKMAGHSTADIAKRLKSTPDTIRHYLYIAGKNGWTTGDGGLELVDPAEQLVFDTAHKIVRNVNQSLDGKVLLPQQFEMTVEAAKGTGLFKTHTAAKVEGAMSIPNLEVRFEFPRGIATTEATPGTFGGVGNYVDGQVVEQAQLTEGDDSAV